MAVALEEQKLNVSHSTKTSNNPLPAPFRPLVVGTVHSPGSLQAAVGWVGRPGGPDLIELRVDHFADAPESLAALTELAPRPFIVTVRDLAEGGAVALSSERRRDLYARFQAHAHLVDIEVRSLPTLGEVVQSFRADGRGIIASFHNFAGTPSLRQLREQAVLASEHGAHVLKVAAMVSTGSDLAVLLEFLATEARLPLALMGMGPLGRASRPVLAAGGSVLNYGFLGSVAQVSGQWPAAVLRERIDELFVDREPAGASAAIERLLARKLIP